MSLYNLSCKIIGRKNGRDAVEAAAYCSGSKLYDEEKGQTKNYTRKTEVVLSEIMLPADAPDTFRDRQTLWNSVQKNEQRSDAQFCRTFEIAFPKELSRAQQIYCAREFIRKNFTSQGMIADWSFHNKKGNPHFHIMVTLRPVDKNGKWLAKGKSVFANNRDEEGKAIYNPDKPVYNPKDKEHTEQYRIPKLDKAGKQKFRERKGKGREYLWEKVNIQFTDWNEHSNMEAWRKSWADICNRFLDDEHRIDHRSYERRGIDLLPTIHLGPAAWALERKGIHTERGDYNRAVRKYNAELLAYKEKQQHVDEEKEQLESQLSKITKVHDEIKAMENELDKMYADKRSYQAQRDKLHGKLFDEPDWEGNGNYGELHWSERPSGLLASITGKTKEFDVKRRNAEKQMDDLDEKINRLSRQMEDINRRLRYKRQDLEWVNPEVRAPSKKHIKQNEALPQTAINTRNDDDKGMSNNWALLTEAAKEEKKNKEIWRSI